MRFSLLPSCLSSSLASQSARRSYLRALRKLIIDTLVRPFWSEKRCDRIAVRMPLIRAHPCHPRKSVIGLRKRSGPPVVHDEHEIRAVLRGCQMAGVRDIVRDVQRHPGRGSHTHAPPRAKGTGAPNRRSERENAGLRCPGNLQLPPHASLGKPQGKALAADRPSLVERALIASAAFLAL